MKILYIITKADGGGAQYYTLQMAKHFKGAIAAGTEDNKLFIDAERMGIKTHQLRHLKRAIRPWSDFLALIEIILLVKAERPDIVHLNSSKAGFLGSLIKPFVKTKIVFTAHGFIFNEPGSFIKKCFYIALEKFASFFRDFIITVSDADRRSAAGHRIISPRKIATVYNGLPTITFLSKDESRKQLAIPERIFTFGTVANFYKTKGLDVLIEAVSQLPQKIKDKSVWIILGDGPERRNLENYIQKLGLEKTVLLPGKVFNAKEYLKAFDVFVFPSRKEGFPYALLEAMQAGLPIVTTRTGGIPETVGISAILVPPENPNALAQALRTIFMDSGMRDSLSKQSLRQSDLFSLELQLQETEQVYNLIKNPSRE